MTKKRKIWISIAFVGIVLAAFIFAYFEPQTLFLNKTANESQQGSVIARSTTPETNPNLSSTTDTTTTLPQKSTWTSREHATTGEVFLTRDEQNNTFVRFENLNTSNGPDLRVLIAKSVSSDGTPSDYVDLGALTANQGDANYLVPSDVDINDYSHTVIWCRRFASSFADAQI